MVAKNEDFTKIEDLVKSGILNQDKGLLEDKRFQQLPRDLTNALVKAHLAHYAPSEGLAMLLDAQGICYRKSEPFDINILNELIVRYSNATKNLILVMQEYELKSQDENLNFSVNITCKDISQHKEALAKANEEMGQLNNLLTSDNHSSVKKKEIISRATKVFYMGIKHNQRAIKEGYASLANYTDARSEYIDKREQLRQQMTAIGLECRL